MSLEILGRVIYVIGNIGSGDMSLEILGQVICHWKYWVR